MLTVLAEEAQGSLTAAALKEAEGARSLRDPARVQRPVQPANWRKRHPVLFSTLIGGGVGAGTGCVLGLAVESEERGLAWGSWPVPAA